VRIAGINYDLNLGRARRLVFTSIRRKITRLSPPVREVGACSIASPTRRLRPQRHESGCRFMPGRRPVGRGAASGRGDGKDGEPSGWIGFRPTSSICCAITTQRETFDLIVLDPPSFTKSKGNKESALRGYHELHLRALRLLTRGGILATFSCSHHVTRRTGTNYCSGPRRKQVRHCAFVVVSGKVPIIPY